MLLFAAFIAVRAAALVGVPRPGLAALPVIALWTPTSLVILVSRYLSRAWDDRPVVLSNGLLISRRDFRAWIAAQAAEGVLAGSLVIALAGWLVTMPVSIAWLAPAFVLSGVYAIVARVLRVRVARGIVALVENEPRDAILAVAPVLAWRPMTWSLVPTARIVRYQAFLLQGDRSAAIAETNMLGAIQGRIQRALLTFDEEPDAARAVLDEPPRLLSEAWNLALLRDLMSLEAGDRDALATWAERRRSLAERLGPRASALSHLIDAARLRLEGETPTVDRQLVTHAAWAAHIWPTLWRLALGPQSGS